MELAKDSGSLEREEAMNPDLAMRLAIEKALE
jgi:hypothetical protein